MNERLERAHEILKKYVWLTSGLGLIPLKIVDIAILVAVQLKMIADLSRLYGIPFSKSRGKSIITSLIGSLSAGGISGGLVAPMVHHVVLVGSMLAFLAMPVFAGASTFAVGKIFIQHFESGGTLMDLDPVQMKAYFKNYFANQTKAQGK